MCVSSPSAGFCAGTGAYSGAVLVGDTGAVVAKQVGLPLYPAAVVAAVCLRDIALCDPSHPWDKVTGTWLTVTATKF